MASAPAFFATFLFGSGLISAANTNLDGTGSLVTILSAVASDTKLEMVRVKARGTTNAGTVRLFLFDGSATYRLLEEVAVTAITPSGTVQSFKADIDYQQMFVVVPSGWSLVASTHNAESFQVFAFGSRA